MAFSPSRRQSYEAPSHAHLVPPPPSLTQEQRRMSSPVLPSLNLSDQALGSKPQEARPPSPLRNSFVPDTFTGINAEDESDDDGEDGTDEGWDRTSPSPSLTRLASNFAQRVGSLVGNMNHMNPRSPFPTDAELEAEAERERDRSRREAERILTQEARERKRVEERMLELLAASRTSPSSSPMPPPPPRSQSMSNPPSPSPSQKEGGTGWWAAAKNKLTSTKEPLTPAQLIVQETKARDKEEKKKLKGKAKDKDWSVSGSSKYSDLASFNLNPPQIHQRKSTSLPSYSPTPSHSNLSNAHNLLGNSPMHLGSPFQEPPPHYALFNSQGVLDVSGTLLVIARRFEKLEKWTVSHVRALEERMDDVERWLVDKEKEKEKEKEKDAAPGIETKDTKQEVSHAAANKEIVEIREEITELQGRVGELGREMAKMVTAPGNLSVGPNRMPPQVTFIPQTTSLTAVRTQTPARPPSSSRDSTSPPISSTNPSSRTRLPYPSGDYASPPDTGTLSPNAFSPTNSPPSSDTRVRPMSISGLPTPSPTSSMSAEPTNGSGLPHTTSLLASPASKPRPSSVSPTPRKRYTVALGARIIAPDEPALTSEAPDHASSGTDSDSAAEHEHGKQTQEDTIGKSVGTRIGSEGSGNGRLSPPPYSGTRPAGSPNNRNRAQSAYGLSSIPGVSSVNPLRPRMRSKSSERIAKLSTAPIAAKFVDPVTLRKQEKPATNSRIPLGKGKVAVGQLVAFFDGEK